MTYILQSMVYINSSIIMLVDFNFGTWKKAQGPHRSREKQFLSININHWSLELMAKVNIYYNSSESLLRNLHPRIVCARFG